MLGHQAPQHRNILAEKQFQPLAQMLRGCGGVRQSYDHVGGANHRLGFVREHEQLSLSQPFSPPTMLLLRWESPTLRLKVRRPSRPT